jgi:YGGT family protein
MSQITDTGRVHPITGQPRELEAPHVNQEILQRVSGLIHLGVSLLNALICTRFLLKLMAANSANLFAELIYRTTQPFLQIFQGLIQVINVNGNVFELQDLIAIAVYAMLGWSLVRFLRIMFARIK